MEADIVSGSGDEDMDTGGGAHYFACHSTHRMLLGGSDMWTQFWKPVGGDGCGGEFQAHGTGHIKQQAP